MRLAFVLFALSGCIDDSPMPRQGEAQAVVWHQVLDAPETCPAPRVVWGVDCTTDTGKPGVSDGWGRCVAGVCFVSRPSLKVMVWLGSFAESAYMHEHVHAWHWCQGIEDAGHTRIEWKTLEPMGRALLRELGL